MIAENPFDLNARDWDKNPAISQRSEAIAKLIRKKFQPGSVYSALEFGSGTGFLSFLLKDVFFYITLMDSSKEMTRIAREKIALTGINNIFPVLFDLEKKNYKKKTFDVIYSQMTLHHVADVNKILEKLFNLLNHPGKLFLIDLYKEDGTFHNKGMTIHKGFDPVYLRNILRQIGFTNVTHKKCHNMIKTFDNGERKKYPLFLISAEKS